MTLARSIMNFKSTKHGILPGSKQYPAIIFAAVVGAVCIYGKALAEKGYLVLL